MIGKRKDPEICQINMWSWGPSKFKVINLRRYSSDILVAIVDDSVMKFNFWSWIVVSSSSIEFAYRFLTDLWFNLIVDVWIHGFLYSNEYFSKTTPFTINRNAWYPVFPLIFNNETICSFHYSVIYFLFEIYLLPNHVKSDLETYRCSLIVLKIVYYWSNFKSVLSA